MNDQYDTPAGLHAVYVVALESDVINTRKFAQHNPGYRAGQPCYYVDVTGLAVDLRFDQLMHGIKGNADIVPASFEVAVEYETQIARNLRAQGCGVWAPVLDAPETSNVYVIHLDEAVLKNRRFRAANPDYVKGTPCVYVGATGLAPEERFANHKAGHKANWYAHTYGDVLLPELFEHLNPMTYQRALATEIAVAKDLRQEGYAVWQN